MLNTNRKLLVASGTLFISPKILNQFSKDHDIVLFNYNPTIDLKQNARALFKSLQKHLDWGYDKYIFLGKGQDCTLCYALYEHKNMLFDAAVFVNYKELEPISDDTKITLAKASKIFSYSTKKGGTPVEATNHQNLNTLFGTTRSKRLAQDIYGQIVYGVYNELYLDGKASQIF